MEKRIEEAVRDLARFDLAFDVFQTICQNPDTTPEVKVTLHVLRMQRMALAARLWLMQRARPLDAAVRWHVRFWHGRS